MDHHGQSKSLNIEYSNKRKNKLSRHGTNSRKRRDCILKVILVLAISMFGFEMAGAQKANPRPVAAKAVSPDLFGLFFEEINYSADGGLYAEQVQNRSFEYNSAERNHYPEAGKFYNGSKTMKVDLSKFITIYPVAEKTLLTGEPDSENTFMKNDNIVPSDSAFSGGKKFDYTMPPMSLTVIRIETKG